MSEKCPNCPASVPPTAAFCPQCGYKVAPIFVAPSQTSENQTQFGLPVPKLASPDPSTDASNLSDEDATARRQESDMETIAFTKAELEAQYAQWDKEHGRPVPAPPPQVHRHMSQHADEAPNAAERLKAAGEMARLEPQGGRDMSWKDSALPSEPRVEAAAPAAALINPGPDGRHGSFILGQGQGQLDDLDSDAGMDSLDESGWGLEHHGPLGSLRRRRPPSNVGHWPTAMVWIGVGILVVASGLLFYGYALVPATALTIQTVDTRVDEGRVYLDVPVSVDVPTTLRYPGGFKTVNGASSVEFSLNASTLPLQRTTVDLFSEYGGVETTHALHVDAYYRIRPVSISERGLESMVTHRAGWTLNIVPGEITPITAKTSRWFVPFQVTPKTLEAKIDVVGPDGRQISFNHSFEIPLAMTPLVLSLPLRGQIYTGSAVTFEGATLPFAQVRIGQNEVVADENGFFSSDIRFSEEGDIRVPVVAFVAGRHERKLVVDIVRGDDGMVSQSRTAQVKRHELALSKAVKAPSYKTLQGGWTPNARTGLLHFAGMVRGMYRAQRIGNHLLISMCSLPKTCPAWVSVSQFVPTKIGQTVKFVGRWIGHHVYETGEGKKVSIPKFEAQSMLP